MAVQLRQFQEKTREELIKEIKILRAELAVLLEEREEAKRKAEEKTSLKNHENII